MRFSALHFSLVLTLIGAPMASAGQQRSGGAPAPSSPAPSAPAASAAGPSSSYVIGTEDVLTILFWGDKNMSGDVTVRPDGKISLPLINELPAVGLTPDQLRTSLMAAASKYLEDANATVVVKEIHSRNVFITGNVTKPGTFSLTSGMNVLQLIALSGGLLEYADAKGIVVIRTENGAEQYHKFNYKDVVKQKHTEQNIVLKPGDVVVVP
jgi:polysaccharide biosynthesis/export protein